MARSNPVTAGDAMQLSPLFCGAPWLEAVVRINGDVFPCARIEQRWGNLATQTLTEIWRSPVAQAFRQSIGGGKAPSATCVTCYRDRTTTTLRRLFDAAIAGMWINYESACQVAGMGLDGGLCDVMPAFHNAIRDPAGADSIAACRALIIAIFRGRRRAYPPAAQASLRKLRVIAWASIDYLRGRPLPRCVATNRQVNLVSVCNARCIYCIGLFNREIVEGELLDGQRYKRMPAAHIPRAFDHMRDITSFFMNGSEFLLYPDWRGLVAEFAKVEVRLKLSTNGMLLTPEASRYLIESRVLQDLNISLDGASRETVERIRPLVRFDVVMQNVAALFAVITEQPDAFVPLSFSMILLQSNVHEAPALVQLADRLRGGGPMSLHLNFQGLNPSRQAGYREFHDTERVDLTDRRAADVLHRAAELARAVGIRIHYGYNGTLEEALDAAALRRAA